MKGRGLVKTVKFGDATYLGDPINIVKLFNDKYADELLILDIMATPTKCGPQFDILEKISQEAFMPLGYGGGIRNIEDIKTILKLGFEKICINSYAVERPDFIAEAVKHFGSQSVMVSIDVKKRIAKTYTVYTEGGRKSAGIKPLAWAKKIEELGAGEILLTAVDRDGVMAGYDIELIKQVSSEVSIPVIACGGAGSIMDFRDAVNNGGASAVAAGSMFVFKGVHRAVLISYCSEAELDKIFAPDSLKP